MERGMDNKLALSGLVMHTCVCYMRKRIQYSLAYEEEDTFQALRAWNAHLCVRVALFVCVYAYTYVCIIHVDIE